MIHVNTKYLTFKILIDFADYIIVHEEARPSEKEFQKREKEERELREKGLPNEAKEEEKQQDVWRKKFFHNIQRAGLEIEEDVVESEKKIITYYKIHAPWNALLFYAEELNFRAPLQVSIETVQKF